MKISTTKRHNSTPTLLKTQYKKCLPSKPRLLFRSLPPRKRKNVKRKPRECSRVSLPRWISNYISFRCLFLSDLDDGWNFGRYPRKNLLFEKRESKSTSRLKTSELNRQIKIYTSTSTEFMSSKSRCRSRRPQTCANSRHQGDENLFFFYLLLFASNSGFCPKRYAKLRRFYSS